MPLFRSRSGEGAEARTGAAPSPLIDTHAHVDLDAYDADRDAVLARASQAGVLGVINPSFDLASSRRAVALAETSLAQGYEVWAAVGIHPHDAAQWGAESEAELRSLAASPRVVAIGEIGLDYYRDLSPRQWQRDAFAAQLHLARALDLPFIVHDRDAHQDVLDVLAAEGVGPRLGVMHCFSGDLGLARRALDLGLYIGVDGPVTFRSAADAHAVARYAPLDRLLVETDSPYLTPAPHRGKRNEPALVRLVAERIAELRGVPFEAVAAATTANAVRLFRLEAERLAAVRWPPVDANADPRSGGDRR